MPAQPLFPELFPLVVYTAVAVLLIGGMLAAAWWLGAKSTNRNKGLPYESGIIPTGDARLAYPVPFYLIAIFFIVFDVEAVFIFAWAIAFREVGWVGYAGVLAFIGVLVAALIYEWRMGALDWGSKGRKDR